MLVKYQVALLLNAIGFKRMWNMEIRVILSSYARVFFSTYLHCHSTRGNANDKRQCKPLVPIPPWMYNRPSHDPNACHCLGDGESPIAAPVRSFQLILMGSYMCRSFKKPVKFNQIVWHCIQHFRFNCSCNDCASIYKKLSFISATFRYCHIKLSHAIFLEIQALHLQ